MNSVHKSSHKDRSSRSHQTHISPARVAALNVLSYVRKRGSYVRDVLHSSPEVKALTPEDRAFCGLLALGVVGTHGVLDEVIDTYLDRPHNIAPALRDVLRIAAYELIYLKKDAHAAVSQGVELAKTVAHRASGLANAVLRKIASSAQDFPFGDPEEDLKAFARLHGFPFELAEFFTEVLGNRRARALMRAQDTPAPLFITSLPTVIDDKDVDELLKQHKIIAVPMSPLPGAWVIPDAVRFLQSDLVEQKGLIPMDYSAQIVAAIVAGNGEGEILEVGSGRGTKSAVITSRALRLRKPPMRITALDVHDYKAKLASDRLSKFRIGNVTQFTADASSSEQLKDLGLYQTVFLDAPCSGSGTLRRHPELVWDTTRAKVKSLARLQLDMLRALAPHVADGGTLLYSTCSVLKQENEDVIDTFLNTHEGSSFTLAPVYERSGLSAKEASNLKDHCTPRGFLQTFPVEGGADGHFCARLVKQG